MTRRLLSLFVAACLWPGLVVAARAKHVDLRPKHSSGEITIVSMGKARTYYLLSSKRPSVLEVKGPGQLRVLTRARFKPKGMEELAYRIIYKVDGGEDQSLEFDEVVRAGNARYRDASIGHPGNSEDFIVKFGRGYHSIDIMVHDSSTTVAARYLFTPGKERKTKWIVLAPLPPMEPVDLFAGEETAHYYRFSTQKPMRIEIIGPTTLRVMTRVENTFDMKGRANYRIQIRQNGQVLQSFQLSSRRSETTIYKNNAKLVPGKAREVVFRVPKGKQEYEIIPLDKGTLLGQIMFPQKDAKLGL